MSIFETIGLAWVVFTSSLATVALVYLSFMGLKTMIRGDRSAGGDMPIEVKEVFKIAR